MSGVAERAGALFQADGARELIIPLETLLVSPQAFGLETATPLQRAICRVSDGLPLEDLWDVEAVRKAFGDVRPPEVAPATLLILAAIRSAKSLMAAAKAVQTSQTVDLSAEWIGLGDIVQIPIVAVDKERGQAVFKHVLENLMAKPILRQLFARDERGRMVEPTAERFVLRHPSGRAIEITVQALAHAGATLVSTWLAGVIFDEAPRMSGSESKRSLEDSLNAVAGRMLPGAQIWMIGSPYAPFGPVYDMVQEHFGKPSEAVVVVRGTGPAMNPSYWTRDRCEQLARTRPAAHRTDVLGQFADPEEALYASADVEACTRAEPAIILPEKGHHYSATMDPATRGNAWTFAVFDCVGLGGDSGVLPKYRVCRAQQWVGSKTKPLRPDAVLGEIAQVCREYGVDMAWTDQHSFDALHDIASAHGLWLSVHTINAQNRLEMAERVRVYLEQRCLELPPDPQIRTDLAQAVRRVTQNGVTLVLPKTGDGRHCDYVPVLGIGLCYPPEPPDEEAFAVEDAYEQQLVEAYARAQSDGLWETVARRLVSTER